LTFFFYGLRLLLLSFQPIPLNFFLRSPRNDLDHNRGCCHLSLSHPRRSPVKT
jgi:hypothetical protein